jgi:hypothetical protein
MLANMEVSLEGCLSRVRTLVDQRSTDAQKYSQVGNFNLHKSIIIDEIGLAHA